MAKLPKNKTNGIWIFPKRICIEPRFVDGSLDVVRVGTAGIARDLGHVETDDQLTKVFFKYNPDKYAGGQEVSDWLTDNGFAFRHRYW